MLSLIRIEAEPTASEALIYTNGMPVAELRNNSHITFEIPVGVHQLSFNWPDTPITFIDELTVELECGEHKYISVLRRFEVQSITKTVGGLDYTMSETLAAFELPPRFAEGVMKNLNERRDKELIWE